MLAPILCALCLAPSLSVPKVVREAERVLLVEGQDRLLLRGSQEQPVLPLGRGAELEVAGAYPTQLRLLRAGQRVEQIDTKDLGFSWLQQDSLWGGEQGGQEARKEAFERGGLRVELQEAHPVPNGILGVVTWRALGPSHGPVWAQHLVRIEAGPKLEVTALRLLPGGRGSYLDPITQRLFRHSGRFLLWLPGKMVEIDAVGTDVSDFADVPPGLAPVGLVDRRWALLLGDEGTPGQFTIGAVDFDKRKAFLLFREPPRGGGLTTRLAEVPELGRYLLLNRAAGTRGAVERITLEVPSGRRIKVQSGSFPPPSGTWKEYAYTYDGSSVTLYEARSGRFLRQLSVPRRPKVR